MQPDACSCTGANLDRFVRPCVMAVLAEHPGGLHGYLIAQRLQEIALFKDSPPDLTGLYRVLKSMASEGYLGAAWDEGHAKRTYTLTPSGHACLAEWSRTLRAYTRDLHATQRYIDQRLATSASTCCAAVGCEC